MSYDVELKDPVTGDILELDSPHQMKGGTYCVGGSVDASLNITWNYGKHYRRVFPDRHSDHREATDGVLTGIRTIYGLTGAESIPVLQAAISQLGNGVADDYWGATEGNAKRALIQLLSLAQMRPDGVWDGD